MPDTLSISYTPGYQFTEGELVTLAKLNLLAQPNIALDGSIGSATIADGAVTTAKIADGALSADATGRAKMADGYLTAAKLNATQDWSGKTLSGNPAVAWTGAVNFSAATFTPPPGHLIQSVSNSTASATAITAATPGGTIPYDDTIPQNNEGTEILTQAITPTAAGSILEIQVVLECGMSQTNVDVVLALFQDSTANALAAVSNATDTFDAHGHQLNLLYRMTAGTTSATTFKLRLGVTGGTVTINGDSGNRRLGGTKRCWLVIREITA